MDLINELTNYSFNFLNILGRINTFLYSLLFVVIIIYGLYHYKKGKKESEEKKHNLKKWANDLKKNRNN